MIRPIRHQSLRLSFAALALIALLAAPVAMAQDEDDGGDDAGNDSVATAAIGCVATYDLVLARGLAGTQVAVVQKARAEAREVYKEAAGLDDNDADADIAQADANLPGLLQNGNTTLQQYRHVCDQLLSDDDDSVDLPQGNAI